MKLKDIMPIKKEEKFNTNFTHIHKKSVGYMGYLCPDCGHVNKIYVACKYTIKAPKTVYVTKSIIEVGCEECGGRFETDMIGIDPNIISVIETLNKLGYKTEFSCEGHVYEDGNVSIPYVRFINSTVIEKYGSPKGWKSEIDEDGKASIYYDEDVKYDNNGKAKQRALGLLEDWVRSFDELKSE